MTNSEKKIKTILIYIFLFLFIYSPIWIKGYDYIQNVRVWSWISLLTCIPTLIRIRRIDSSMLQDRNIVGYYGLIILAAFYFFIRYLISADSFSFQSSRIIQNLFPIISMLNLTAVVFIMGEMGYSRLNGFLVLLRLGAFQGAICLIMLAIPMAKTLAEYLFLNGSTSFRMGDYILRTRIYGISSDYTYGLPITHGFICGIGMYITLKYDKKYFIYTVLTLITVFFNGRTGLLIALITMLIAIFGFITWRNVRVSSIIIVIISIIGAIIALSIVRERIPTVYKFVALLFTDIKSSSGTIDYLTDTGLFFPEGLGLIFGEGHNVYGAEARAFGLRTSDIGFVNDLFMGGFVYLVIRYTAVARMIIPSIIQRNTLNRFLAISCAIMWILACYKGQATTNTMIIVIIQITYLIKNYLPEDVSSEENQKIPLEEG